MPSDITVQQSPAKQHVGDADSLEIGLLTALGIQAEGEREISELLGRRPRGGVPSPCPAPCSNKIISALI